MWYFLDAVVVFSSKNQVQVYEDCVQYIYYHNGISKRQILFTKKKKKSISPYKPVKII